MQCTTEGLKGEFEEITRRTISCNVCFDTLTGIVRPAPDDVAQPRWIGPNYWTSNRKVAVILTNPGAGTGTCQATHQRRRELLRRFELGTTTLEEVFNEQFADLVNWGNPPGRFQTFVQTALGLSFSNIAVLNIAWCAALKRNGKDGYPTSMLKRCFDLHAASALKVLNPTVVILCGGPAQRFAPKLRAVCFGAKVFDVLHYGHRKGRIEEERSTEPVRRCLMVS